LTFENETSQTETVPEEIFLLAFDDFERL
jgi:hypothetical protein